MKIISYLFIAFLFTCCGEKNNIETGSDLKTVCFGIPSIQKLKKHCSSCHGLGNDLVFLTNENDCKNWNFIFNSKEPKGSLWSTAIIESLSWPSHIPPSNHEKSETGRMYMPLGGKKEAINKKSVLTRKTDRELILEDFQRAMNTKSN